MSHLIATIFVIVCATSYTLGVITADSIPCADARFCRNAAVAGALTEPNNGTAKGEKCTIYNMPCSYENSICLSNNGNMTDLICQCDLSAIQESGNICKKQSGTICTSDLECMSGTKCIKTSKDLHSFCGGASGTFVVSVLLTTVLQLILKTINI